MTTREYYEGVVEDALAESGIESGDEKAVEAVMSKIAESYGSIDDFATELDHYVCAEALRRIAPIAHAVMEAGGEYDRVPAHVVYQVWRNDYAEEVGEARFDARRALDRLGLDLVSGIEAGRPGLVTDDVFYEAAAIGLVDGNDGQPFDCYIDDAEALAAYVEARGKREAAR